MHTLYMASFLPLCLPPAPIPLALGGGGQPGGQGRLRTASPWFSCSPARSAQQPVQPEDHGGSHHGEKCHPVLRGLRLLLRAGGAWPAHG